MTASPLTLFPIRQRMRANLFTYRAPGDVWLRELRVAPVKTVSAALLRLTQITGKFTVSGEVKIRPADLTISAGYRRAGLVHGDAFASTCPVTGTGTDKVFTDVERLCNIHIPTWLVSEGMVRTRSRPSMTIPSRRPATPGRWRRPSHSARSRWMKACTGRRSAWRAS
jgi:hypothetical protein